MILDDYMKWEFLVLYIYLFVKCYWVNDIEGVKNLVFGLDSLEY